MIHPSQLTKEAGFEEGVVVEIVDDNQRVFVGRLSHVTEWNIWLVESNFHGFTFKEVQSIRPLTGPMAIWNFAPEWAKSVWITSDTIEWFTGPAYEPKYGIVYDRPWWCK